MQNNNIKTLQAIKLLAETLDYIPEENNILKLSMLLLKNEQSVSKFKQTK